MRPSQGFWGFREKGYLFSGIWGEGSFIFRDLGRKRNFREQGVEEKHFRELGRKVIFLSRSREQRPPPPPGGASIMRLIHKEQKFKIYISFVILCFLTSVSYLSESKVVTVIPAFHVNSNMKNIHFIKIKACDCIKPKE